MENEEGGDHKNKPRQGGEAGRCRLGTFLLCYTDACLPGKEADTKGGEVFVAAAHTRLISSPGTSTGVELLKVLTVYA